MALLEHASRAVPFYNALVRSSRKDLCLRDLPLIDRQAIADALPLFIAGAATKPLCVIRSSGTTGPPIRVVFDAGSWYRSQCIPYIKFAERFQVDRGKYLGSALADLVTTKDSLRSQCWTVPPWGFTVTRAVLTGRTSTHASRTIKDIRRRGASLLYGKPSYLLQLMQMDSALGPLRVHPRGIVTGGENLYPDQRRALECWFKCPVRDSYASVEGGLIALECRYGGPLHVDPLGGLLEVLRNSQLESEGFGELILTNLSNWMTTFIRYRTGDMATLTSGACRCGFQGQSILHLYGREAVHIQGARGPVDSRAVDKALMRLPIRSYRMVQMTNATTLVSVIPLGSFSQTALRGLVKQQIRRVLGHCRISVSFSTEIPPLGTKARRFVTGIPD